ncbi:hypothetical protein [Streptomyces sp. cg35]|uniref:hypothetical protein n=1 Tax=Streptomyces sp. cg35 TaxID=3421650 RepID=UPI003D166A92
MTPWERAERLDADRLADALRARTGTRLTAEGPVPAGRWALRPAWAHMRLRMTDRTIRHFTPDEVEHWLDLAERRLD